MLTEFFDLQKIPIKLTKDYGEHKAHAPMNVLNGAALLKIIKSEFALQNQTS